MPGARTLVAYATVIRLAVTANRDRPGGAGKRADGSAAAGRGIVLPGVESSVWGGSHRAVHTLLGQNPCHRVMVATSLW
jgi:hypothetical protein